MKKVIKVKNFRDNESRLTAEDIDECNDMTQILKWKHDIDGKIVEVQIKIDTARGKVYSDGEYSKPDWWANINGYRRVLGFLSQKLQFKIRELKNEDKLKQGRTIEGAFVDAARELLTREDFMEIMDHAKKIIQPVAMETKSHTERGSDAAQ